MVCYSIDSNWLDLLPCNSLHYIQFKVIAILHLSTILDRVSSHYEDDAVSPPSSPTPGVKIFQGKSMPIDVIKSKAS